MDGNAIGNAGTLCRQIDGLIKITSLVIAWLDTLGPSIKYSLILRHALLFLTSNLWDLQ